MGTAINWILANWSALLVPVAVFLFVLLIVLLLRRRIYEALDRWLSRSGWKGNRILLRAFRVPSLLWCFIAALYVGLTVSALPLVWKALIGNGLGTIFVLSLSIAIFRFGSGLILIYGEKYQIPWHGIVVTRNIARIVILIVTVLALLDIWGIRTSTAVLLIGVVILAAALAFRDALSNLLAGSQLGTTKKIRAGDYIKLDTGEEGSVVEVKWDTTLIKAPNESLIIIPNSRLLRQTIINYGHLLKKAKEPFRFNSRAHMTELTGLRARNLRELRNILKTASDATIFFHTHHFLQEHHFLTPEPSNDLAVWVTDALGDQVLGERLASVDTFEFTTLESLKERMVSILDEYLATEAPLREAMEGREFYFMKSISVIFALPDVVTDLREFVAALSRISTSSLYFHIFEARLRLGKGLNDFSIWLRDSLGEEELAEEIARHDPYTYTLEGLRSSLIRLVEKRIQ
ncbi:MAG: mechanosensitive ion channel family protein [Chloroflexi bacterium]|nr:mechanosensitive ion channel family protein [Chloroflexota bacterium]